MKTPCNFYQLDHDIGWLVWNSTGKKNHETYQFQPRGTRVVDEVLWDGFLTDRLENTGIWKLVTGEDAKEWNDVCMRETATDKGMAVEPLYSMDQIKSGRWVPCIPYEQRR